MVQDYDYDDDVIELTEVVTEESSPQMQETIELSQQDPEPGDLFSQDVPLAMENSEESMPELEQHDLEAALEKVIEKKFSETIEKILFEVMEKVIKKEIEEIKAGLQKDLDDIG